ncbi:MAG: restriction endonuclease subunit S [Planctomycetales bacterium]|nr:restriction endonuclease subunit S [Planctomycetales bacterium]
MSEALGNGWAYATLGDVATLIGGSGFPEAIQNLSGNEFPFFKVRHLALGSDTELLFDSEHTITKEHAKKLGAKLIPPGSIVFAKVGEAIRLNRRRRIGKPSHIDNNMMAAIPLPGVESRWLFRLLQTVNFYSLAQATTVPSVRKSDITRLSFSLPPSAEQRRIADRIDELFTDLTAGTAALERVQKKLRRYRAAVLHAAVTGRLTAKWREEQRKRKTKIEPAEELLKRILTARREAWEDRTLAKYAEQGKQPPKGWKDRYRNPTTVKPGDLPQLPQGWCWATNDELVGTITSGSRDWTPFYGRGSGTFIMAQNVRMGRLERGFRQAVDPPVNDRDRIRSQVEKDDLLVTIVGANTGDVCRVSESLDEHYVCQSVALMRPVLSQTSSWLLTWFTSPSGAQAQFRKHIYGAGRPHLGFDHLQETVVALPPLEEQPAIAEAVQEKTSQIEALEAEIEHGLKRAGRLRQAILKAAFDGKLVPQDPADEPATVLLERIRSEREQAAADKQAAKQPAVRKSNAKKQPATMLSTDKQPAATGKKRKARQS